MREEGGRDLPYLRLKKERKKEKVVTLSLEWVIVPAAADQILFCSAVPCKAVFASDKLHRLLRLGDDNSSKVWRYCIITIKIDIDHISILVGPAHMRTHGVA